MSTTSTTRTTIMSAKSQRWLGYGACAMAGCLWGTGFYFGKLALREMGVGHMVLYRFLFASLGMLPILLTSSRRTGRNGPDARRGLCYWPRRWAFRSSSCCSSRGFR